MSLTFIPFPNENVRESSRIVEAFAAHDIAVEDICRECWFLTTVLDSNGNLWSHDISHGGGGYFWRNPNDPAMSRARLGRKAV